MEMRAKAVGYVRVSTEVQAVDGVSLEAQKAKISGWAEANGFTLLSTHVDAGISGFKTANRPGLQLAIAEACRGRSALVVYSLSRLARSTQDALSISDKLSKAGADLVSLSERIDTTTASGKMVFRMLAVLAEFERDLISERTTTAMAHKKANMERVGAVPYGFSMNGDTLTPFEPEQAVLTRLRAFRQSGTSYNHIAEILNREGVPTKQGGKWHGGTVHYILANSLHLQNGMEMETSNGAHTKALKI